MSLSRRAFVARSAAIGCSLAASPFLTRVSLASAPWDTRLVVIMLRGAMDGLDAVRPYGAPEFATYRAELMGQDNVAEHDLDGYFALHPALSPLLPLWREGQFGVVHAVSTPYRDKRSHFDGQDLLESGAEGLGAVKDGWLNRALGLLPGVDSRTAFAIGYGEMKVLEGPVPVADWSPEVELSMSAQAIRLAEQVMEDDPAFHAAFAEAIMLAEDETGSEGGKGGGKPHLRVAEYAAQQLRGDTRIAAFSLNGWDTHARQGRVISTALTRLSDTITTLREDLGPEIWGKTAVVAMTEFGRTVRVNGTGGTDHGTGGAMFLAGGAVKGGKVYGQWPGLSEDALYQRRDLMPTGDVRATAGWLLHGMAGLDRAALEGTIFPGLDLGSDPGLLL